MFRGRILIRKWFRHNPSVLYPAFLVNLYSSKYLQGNVCLFPMKYNCRYTCFLKIHVRANAVIRNRIGWADLYLLQQ